MNPINPVVVIGVNRNGTTMLANTLIKEFQVSALNHPLHFGFLESNVYPNLKYYGKFDSKDKYISFLNEYLNSDLFISSGVDSSFFWENPTEDFFDFFFDMMDQLTLKEGNQSFLFKLDPDIFLNQKDLTTFFNRLSKRYQNIKIVCIQRKFEDYLNSEVFMRNQEYRSLSSKFFKLFKKWTSSAYYFTFYKSMKSFTERKKGVLIKFENLIKEREKTLGELNQYFQIPRQNQASSSFVQNSSFQNKKRKIQREKASIIKFLLTSFPFLGRLVISIKRFFHPPYQKPILYYHYKKAAFFKPAFIKELEKKGHTNLIKELNENY